MTPESSTGHFTLSDTDICTALDEITEVLKQLRTKHEDLNQRIERLSVEMDPDAELRIHVRYGTERDATSEDNPTGEDARNAASTRRT